ncbi:hypothetical protein M5E87_06250 [Flavonifractor plautii]|nr:hypothetical protein M5E87_06250 [Flavonifractor plautii]
MYCGRVLETNAARELFEHPRHPYTQGLIASLPHLGMKPMAGFSPAFTDQPSGCVFHPRCPYAEARCLSIQSRNPSPVEKGACVAIATLEVQHLSKVFTPTAFADAPTRRWTMFPSPSGPDKLMG